MRHRFCVYGERLCHDRVARCWRSADEAADTTNKVSYSTDESSDPSNDCANSGTEYCTDFRTVAVANASSFCCAKRCAVAHTFTRAVTSSNGDAERRAVVRAHTSYFCSGSRRRTEYGADFRTVASSDRGSSCGNNFGTELDSNCAEQG